MGAKKKKASSSSYPKLVEMCSGKEGGEALEWCFLAIVAGSLICLVFLPLLFLLCFKSLQQKGILRPLSSFPPRLW